MAMELQAFPYIPMKLEPAVRNTGGNIATGRMHAIPPTLAALVYHDIIQNGGFGTRRDVRISLDRQIFREEARNELEAANGEAGRKVAVFRLDEPWKVTPPMLPDGIAGFYERIEEEIDPEWLKRIQEHGIWVARGLKRHTKKPYGHKGVEAMVQKARDAWRAALQATGDDTALWLEEQEKLKQLATALGGSMQLLNRFRQRGQTTRLITLDEFD